MNKLKTLITKSYGTVKMEINEDLQKTNPLSVRGIYLITVEKGVVWGYDVERYEIDSGNGYILRKRTIGRDSKQDD